MYPISVIIPVYNVEEYIEECLESIINQTIGINNIEVIIIDDCSTDNTLNIVEKYAETYPSIKLMCQEINKGPGPARNLGIENATGEYITFLDGDDYISTNTYETCIKIIQENPDADLVIYKYALNTPEDVNIKPDIHQEIYKKPNIITNPNETPELIFSTSPWNKLYSKNLKPYLNFPSMLYEDNITSAKTILNSKKTIITTDATYYYRFEKENNSRSQKITIKNINDLIKSIKQILNLQKEYPKNKKILKYLSLKFTYDILYWFINLKFTYEELMQIYNKLKEISTEFDDETLKEFEEKFPIYEFTNIKALKDLEKLNVAEYLFQYRYTKLIQPEYQATLYIKTPDDTIEAISQKYTMQPIIELEFNIEKYKNLDKIRFDPLENHISSCKILETTPKLKIIHTNAQNPTDDTQIFLTKDPQYFLKGNLKNTKTVKIKFSIDLNNTTEINKYVNTQIRKLNEKIEELEFEIYAKDKIIENKNKIIQIRDDQIKEITTSKSWKITKPIRKIRR